MSQCYVLSGLVADVDVDVDVGVGVSVSVGGRFSWDLVAHNTTER